MSGSQAAGKPTDAPKSQELLHQEKSLNPTLQMAPRSLTPVPRPPPLPSARGAASFSLGGL